MPKGIKGFQKGYTFWLGKHFTKEMRKKLSISHKRAWKEGKYRDNPTNSGNIAWNKGKKTPIEIRRKLSKAHIGYKQSSRHKIKKNISLRKFFQLKEPTSIEKKVYDELKKRGLLFEKQKLINGKFIVDAYIPSLNLVIEADGDYWHSLDIIKKKDKAENAYLTKCEFNLLRLTETEINNGKFIERISRSICS